MHFYDVGGHLIRRPRRVPRGVCADIWKDDGWHAFSDLDVILRHGHRLQEADALALLHRNRHGEEHARWTDQHARVALRAPRRPDQA